MFMKMFYKIKETLSRFQTTVNRSALSEPKLKDIIDDLQWNTEGKWGYRPPRLISQVIVHQAMSKGPTSKINQYHISTDSHIKPGVGAPHIAYHYTVEKDGTIYQCNKDTDITWHTKGQNTKSIGICVVGNFSGRCEDGTAYVGKGNPTKPQLEALNYLLNRLMVRYELHPKDIYGHCDFGKPACPGNKVQTWIENWR